MSNYSKTITLVREMIEKDQRRELRRLVQNFHGGLAMIQFAVAEIEVELGFTPASAMETLLLVEQEIKAQGLVRQLNELELNFVRYMSNAWVQAYDDWTNTGTTQTMLPV